MIYIYIYISSLLIVFESFISRVLVGQANITPFFFVLLVKVGAFVDALSPLAPFVKIYIYISKKVQDDINNNNEYLTSF